MSTPTTPYWVTGRPRTGTEVLEVRSPYDGAVAGRTTLATATDVEAAVAAADRARAECPAPRAPVRAPPRAPVPGGLAEGSEGVAALIPAESGKPLKWARM